MASVLGQALDLLRDGKPARLTEPKDDEEARLFRQAQLLTAKPVLYVCNAAEIGRAFSPPQATIPAIALALPSALRPRAPKSSPPEGLSAVTSQR